MNAIAKASAAALVLVACAPIFVVTGCDKFKKSGDLDAGLDAATPAVTAVDTTTADTASASAAPTVHGAWKPVAHDAGVMKLPDGGLAIVVPTAIPTPIPSGSAPKGLTIPTALPSNIVIPTALPSNLTIPSALPKAK